MSPRLECYYSVVDNEHSKRNYPYPINIMSSQNSFLHIKIYPSSQKQETLGCGAQKSKKPGVRASGLPFFLPLFIVIFPYEKNLMVSFDT